MHIKAIATQPIDGQKPGTGGLRARTRDFMRENYLENFVASAMTVLTRKEVVKSFVIGSDGRYPGQEFLPKIIKLLLAYGIDEIIIAGRHFIAPTPAISHTIRKYNADGGFILSASHNPAGVDGDFGIKTQMSNGGGAPEAITNAIYAETQKITEYKIADISDEEALNHNAVKLVDAPRDYIELLRGMFDFPAIKNWLANHKFVIDCMNAAAGPTARMLFCDQLGVPQENIWRSVPMDDFGGVHPEPNPTYAPELYEFMMNGNNIGEPQANTNNSPSLAKGWIAPKAQDGVVAAEFGAALDGDGDRDMVLGSGFFIYPSDALAIMALHHDAIPYFKNNWKGAARSRPTSSALDFVQPGAHAVPTGWKYFASLLDAGLISICGEESFGQGGDYIREKDGLFAVLYWLNILAVTGKTARELVTDMWKKYGRVFYSQYSYEGVDKAGADRTLEYITSADLIGQVFDGHKIISKEVFNYTDPVTGEVARDQGIEIKTDDGIRIFFRLSGTGTVGATLRFYLERHETDATKFDMRGQDYLHDLYDTVAKIFKLDEFFTPVIKPSAIN